MSRCNVPGAHSHRATQLTGRPFSGAVVRRPLGLLGSSRGRSGLLAPAESRIRLLCLLELSAVHVVRCAVRVYR